MKEKIKMAAENTEELLDYTGNRPEQISDNVDDKTTDLQKKARKTEILEEVKAKLGITPKMEERLLHRTDHIMTQAKDHVEVRTEQWVKDLGFKKDQLMTDLEERTNHLLDKVKKHEPLRKAKDKSRKMKKQAHHALKMVARKVDKVKN